MPVLLAFIRLVGPQRAVEIFGIRLVGINAETGRKFLVTLALLVTILLLWWVFHYTFKHFFRARGRWDRFAFWLRQTVRLLLSVVLVVGLLSIWFNDPRRMTTALGLFSAVFVLALQKPFTAFAGYFVILRSRLFKIGDRIAMSGIRGDVIAIKFIQTHIMEIGQPPSVETAKDVWVMGRQYTGRIVSVSNASIFEDAVYNYTRDFPYIWEEMSIPIRYGTDYSHVEQIMLAAVKRHSVSTTEMSQEALLEMQRRYFVKLPELENRVYYRLTDNWLELTARFIVEERGMREVMNALSREILFGLEAAGIDIASTTIELAHLPKVHVEKEGRDDR